MARSQIPIEDVIAAYLETGSVWRAAQRLNLAGQTVWERLRGVGHPLRGTKWTTGELDELRRLSSDHSLTQIAHALGRPYGGVACKASELRLSGSYNRRGQQALPRGAGYDKATTLKRVREVGTFDGSLRQFCRANGIKLDPFVKAIQRHAPEWWTDYTREHSDLPQVECPYCGVTYYPMTKKQQTCSRRCSTQMRDDAAYFGGRRREAIGMRAGVCQLCGREGAKGLSAHHVFGKDNDPENEVMVALCAGCHQLVSHLAGRRFVEDPTALEALIGLAIVRRRADSGHRNSVWVSVTIDHLDGEDEATGAFPDTPEIAAANNYDAADAAERGAAA